MKKHFTIILLLLIHCLNISSKDNTVLKVSEYSTEHGLSHRMITSILQDNDGLMWFGTWNGLCSFDGYNFRVYKQSNTITSNRIDEIALIEDGLIACRMYNDSNYVFNPADRTFSVCKIQDTELFARKSPKFWVDYKDNSLYITNRSTNEVHNYPIGENTAITLGVHRYFIDRQDNIWLNFNDKLYKISIINTNYDYFTNIEADNTPFNSEVRAIMTDHLGRQWVATKNKTISVYDSQRSLIGYLDKDGKITNKQARLCENTYTLFQDSDNDIWIGTKGGGFYLLKPKSDQNSFSIRHYTNEGTAEKNQISNNAIYSIIQDSLSQIWIATYGGGLNRVIKEKSGELTFSQCDRYSSLINHKHGIRLRHVHLIDSNTIAAASTTGLLIYNNHGEMIQRIGTLNVMNILKDSEGTIYVGTLGNGMNILEKNGNEWGLVQFKPEHGESPEVIMSITEDKNKDLWIVSDNFITKYSKQDSDFIKYGQEFFNRSIIFSESQPLFTEGEDLLTGVADGYIRINTADLNRNEDMAPLILTSVKVNNKAYNSEINPNLISSINLQEKNSNMSIEFATLDYFNPGNIRYAYNIEGVTDGWVKLNSRNSLSLAGLRAGKHTLKIRSTNSHRVWTDNERSITINVSRSIWSYLWVPMTALLAVIIILLGRKRRTLTQIEEKIAEVTIQPVEEKPIVEAEPKTSAQFDIAPKKPEIIDQHKVFINKVMEYMEENMDNAELCVDDFADHLGYSRSSFYRMMKDTLDVKPVDFIRQVRIKRASDLLSSQQYNVSQVAFLTGFNDSKYFSKVFKKEKGITPSEYIINNQTSEPSDETAKVVSE